MQQRSERGLENIVGEDEIPPEIAGPQRQKLIHRKRK